MHRTQLPSKSGASGIQSACESPVHFDIHRNPVVIAVLAKPDALPIFRIASRIRLKRALQDLQKLLRCEQALPLSRIDVFEISSSTDFQNPNRRSN